MSDSATDVGTETLPGLPDLGPRYVSALLPRFHRPDTLPQRRLVVDGLGVDRDALADYARVCGFGLDGALPVTYPQVLAFALQVRLMSEPDFPLRLPGLVHLRQRMHQRRPIDAGEPLRLRVWAEQLRAHPKGTTVDLVTEVTAGTDTGQGAGTGSPEDEPAWSGRSTYLARSSVAAAAEPVESPEPTEVPADRATARFEVPADIGRRYAGVSGDVNPIHLHPLSARLFGFPSAIAHGMWTAARCLATLGGRLPDAYTVDVVFRSPLRLPSSVALASEPAAGGWNLTLRSADGRRVHLVAAIRT